VQLPENYPSSSSSSDMSAEEDFSDEDVLNEAEEN
jgi:hypothetical protein